MQKVQSYKGPVIHKWYLVMLERFCIGNDQFLVIYHHTHRLLPLPTLITELLLTVEAIHTDTYSWSKCREKQNVE